MKRKNDGLAYKQNGMQKDDNKKRVLMVASVASMIDQFNMSNICMLQQMGYEVHVACNFQGGNTCNIERIQKFQKILIQMGIVWHQWDCPRSIQPIWRCARAYQELLKLLKKDPFVWMHCHSPIGGALARIAAHQWNVSHRHKIRVIYTAHGFHFYKGAPLRNWLLYYPVEKLIARWTDVLITVNQEDYCRAKRCLQADKIFYIPGVGIDTQRYAACMKIGLDDMHPGREFRKKYGIEENALVLLSVGELSKRKNHQIVISALAALHRKDVYYVICGQGDQRKALAKQACRLGVSSYVRMPGFIEDMQEFYQNADIFVFPSIQEGMPVALMEAMAAGLPCVVSDIRGNRELISREGGRLYEQNNMEQLMEAVAELLDDSKLRVLCGSFNLQKIKQYDSKKVNARMQTIYREQGCG